MTPSLEFEKTRRLVEHGVQEMWWFFSDQLRLLRKKVEVYSEYTSHIDKLLLQGADQVRSVNF